MENRKIIEEKLGKRIKKPVCAYSLYVQDIRQQIKDRNPLVPHVEIMKIVSQHWKVLDCNTK